MTWSLHLQQNCGKHNEDTLALCNFKQHVWSILVIGCPFFRHREETSSLLLQKFNKYTKVVVSKSGDTWNYPQKTDSWEHFYDLGLTNLGILTTLDTNPITRTLQQPLAIYSKLPEWQHVFSNHPQCCIDKLFLVHWCSYWCSTWAGAGAGTQTGGQGWAGRGELSLGC